MDPIQELKLTMHSYKDVDDKLHSLNKDVATLRSRRAELETTMASILSRPELAAIEKLELKEDNSYVRIARPETWMKPWAMSKRDLEIHLKQYFTTHSRPTADECFKYLCASQKIAGTTFKFERVVRKRKHDDTMDDENE